MRTVQVEQTGVAMAGPLYHRQRWCDDEVEHLREGYASTPAAALAAELGRSVGAVRRMASKMGLRVVWQHRKRRLDAAAKGHNCRNWSQYMAERRRVKSSWQWPGCRSPAEVATCRALEEMGEATLKALASRRGVTTDTQRAVTLRLVRDGMVIRRKVEGSNEPRYSLRPRNALGINKALGNLEAAACLGK